jgi:hypothetical protein
LASGRVSDWPARPNSRKVRRNFRQSHQAAWKFGAKLTNASSTPECGAASVWRA